MLPLVFPIVRSPLATPLIASAQVVELLIQAAQRLRAKPQRLDDFEHLHPKIPESPKVV